MFHDRQALQRAESFRNAPERLRFTDEEYLDHESWIRPAVDLLQEVRGLDVLDYGCGHGMCAVMLARRGAQVTATDLSGSYLAEAEKRAEANGVSIRCVHADAERLPFADASFDRIWGNAILHHLDIHQAATELHRVLRPGGWAVVCEPWGGNPVVRWARNRQSCSGKTHTPDEQPLRQREIRVLRQTFPDAQLRGFQLLAILKRLISSPLVLTTLERGDQQLLTHVPVLQRLCRYMVLMLPR